MFEVPNLDGLSINPDDLDSAAEVLERLTRYARLKATAMRQRLRGDITNALANESRLETIYNQLPKWARW